MKKKMTQQEQESAERKKPGRRKLPPELKTTYKGFRVSLTDTQRNNLEDLAEVLDIRSRSEVSRGKISVRTMIALAAEHAPRIIRAIQDNVANGVYTPIRITSRISLIITPERKPETTNGMDMEED